MNKIYYLLLFALSFSCSDSKKIEEEPIIEADHFIFDTNRVQLGEITHSNPMLWLDLNTLGTDLTKYEVSNKKPSGNWFAVNQYCSVLTTFWLNKTELQELAFNEWTLEEKKEATIQLISFTSLQDQVNYAEQSIGGQEVTKQDFFNELNQKKVGALAWLGNDVHVIGIRITKAGYVLYDSNTGKSTAFQNMEELKGKVNAYRANVFVVTK